MQYRDTLPQIELDDDTGYETWLREHALEAEVTGGG